MGEQSQETSDTTPPDPDDGMPRWVKVFAIVGAAAVMLVVIVVLVGGGLRSHGPGLHLPGGDTSEVEAPGEHTPPPGIPDHG